MRLHVSQLTTTGRRCTLVGTLVRTDTSSMFIERSLLLASFPAISSEPRTTLAGCCCTHTHTHTHSHPHPHTHTYTYTHIHTHKTHTHTDTHTHHTTQHSHTHTHHANILAWLAWLARTVFIHTVYDQVHGNGPADTTLHAS